MGKNKLHLISTGKQTVDEFVNIVEKVHKQADYIHIRERKWTAACHIKAIEKLKARLVPLEKIIINDRVDIAYVKRCIGVQLASHSLPITSVKRLFRSLQIGCSIHSKEEAIKKEKEGADYLIFGHVFTTDSKKDLSPRGLKELKEIIQAVNIPVIAIGGIKPNNVREVLRTGAQGIAVLSGVFLANNPKRAINTYRQNMKGVNKNEFNSKWTRCDSTI